MPSPYHGEDNNRKNKDENRKEKESIEMIFKNVEIPKWHNQITIRALMASVILSGVVIFIVMSCSLSTGMVPSFNVAAGLLGFAFLKFYTVCLRKIGLLKQPFTRQENTIIQTCIISAAGISFTGGLSTYLLSMSSFLASRDAGVTLPINVKNIQIGWVIAFLFSVSFIGLFSIVPLRKMMIVNYKLPYPSGTATAFLINSFHTPKGGKLAMKQVNALFKSFGFSFLFAAYKWLFTSGDNCGFESFPTFGMKAFANRFMFDFQLTYVGIGMICPYMVSVSLLVGALISWGILWPWIATKEGDWYPANLDPTNLLGLPGYKIFLAIGLIMGDGIFQFFFISYVTLRGLVADKMGSKNESSALMDDEYESDGSNGKGYSHDDKKRLQYFLKDSIPNSYALIGYCVLAVVGVICVPIIFDYRIKWYHIICGYIIAPVMALSNAYGVGLTDVSLAGNYGKIAVLVFSSWIGLEEGGIVAGLAGCGVMMNIVFVAGELMNDFKAGYLTLTSPRSMFISQLFGTSLGCIISPLVYTFMSKAYTIGSKEGNYPAPNAVLFRGIALLGVKGFSSLPKNCLKLSITCLVIAFLLNVVTQLLAKYETKYGIHRFIPNPMCLAIPFYLGGYFAVDMCVGSLLVIVWKMMNKKRATDFSMVVASGLMCGESIFGVPAAIFSLIKFKPPMCMTFFSAPQYEKVYNFLNPPPPCCTQVMSVCCKL